MSEKCTNKNCINGDICTNTETSPGKFEMVPIMPCPDRKGTGEPAEPEGDRILVNDIRKRIDGESLSRFNRLTAEGLFQYVRDWGLAVEFQPRTDWSNDIDSHWYCVLFEADTHPLSRTVQGNGTAETVAGSLIIALHNLSLPAKQRIKSLLVASESPLAGGNRCRLNL